MQDPTNGAPRQLEDIRVEQGRRALDEYRARPIDSMSGDEVTAWCGRFAIVVENLLDHLDQTAVAARTPQHRAHALLGAILDLGVRAGLPVIEWSIATHGLITGRCFHPDHAQRPAELRAWADALGLHDWPELESSRGKRLQAVRENLAAGVDVEVVAHIPVGSGRPDHDLVPTAKATRYEVSCLPEEHEARRAMTIVVAYRGRSLWAVLRDGMALGADGTWDVEPTVSERGHDQPRRFDLDTALQLAKEHAPTLTAGGRTAAKLLGGGE